MPAPLGFRLAAPADRIGRSLRTVFSIRESLPCGPRRKRGPKESSRETRIDEVADGIFRLSTFVAGIASPAGFTFNQVLVLGDDPLMFHTGLRKMFEGDDATALGALAEDYDRRVAGARGEKIRERAA